MSDAPTALLLTGGHSHPPELTVESLEAVLRAAGLRTVATTDIETALSPGDLDRHSLLVVNALRFTMSAPRYEPFRDAWAFSPSADARAALSGWVESGQPLLALHTALVSFDDWPAWGDLIGGRWDWDRSHHGPIGPVEVVGDAEHAVTRGLGSFTTVDECYRDLDLRDASTVIATAATDGRAPQPVCWVREEAPGRVAVSALGHDRRSLDEPGHRALIARMLAWLLRTPTPEEGTHDS